MNGFLKIFKSYLIAGLTRGSGAPPVSIKAQDLDDNFMTLTIIPDTANIIMPIYKKEGTMLEIKCGDKTVEWIELSICVDGTPMKMKVLGTAPYSS